MIKTFSIDELYSMLNSRPSNTREAIELFKKAAEYVTVGADERKRDEKRHRMSAAQTSSKTPSKLHPPFDNENGFFKRGAYVLITRFIEWQYEGAIEAIVKCDSYNTSTGPSLSQNPFRWGLMAFYAKDELGPQKRRLFANQMLYACRHGVPEHFLIGFLYQLGRTDRIHEKVSSDQREPWIKMTGEQITG